MAARSRPDARPHPSHDPHVKAGDGPAGMVESIRTYQDGVDGNWQIDDLFSTGDKVVARWTGSGRHVGDVNGIPATGHEVSEIEAISIHRMERGKIAVRPPRTPPTWTASRACLMWR